MAKTKIIGEYVPSKPIEFEMSLIRRPSVLCLTKSTPFEWDWIELIAKGEHPGEDIMFAYMKNNRNNGTLFLGNWNSGTTKLFNH